MEEKIVGEKKGSSLFSDISFTLLSIASIASISFYIAPAQDLPPHSGSPTQHSLSSSPSHTPLSRTPFPITTHHHNRSSRLHGVADRVNRTPPSISLTPTVFSIFPLPYPYLRIASNKHRSNPLFSIPF
jgi:hypothetical protein